MDEVNGIGQMGAEAQNEMEEMISRERATELVKREKEAAYRKAERDFNSRLEGMRTGQTQGMGGMQQFNPDEFKSQMRDEIRNDLISEMRKSQEEAQKAQYENFVKDQVQTYLTKMNGAEGLAEDFKEMTAKFKPERFKEVFYLANSFENTPAMVYELAKNPQKLASIDYLAKHDPEMAKEMLDSLSKSIITNEQAKQSHVSAPSPLTRSKPSLTAGADSGAMSLRDLKKSSFLRA